MLKVSNLSSGYGKEDVVHHIFFQLTAGEKLCILGPNGCGKTTLLRAMAGLLESTGSITVEGLDIQTASRRQIAQKIALMSQITSVSFSYTVYETVMMGRYIHGKPSLFSQETAADRAVVLECLAKTDTLELQNRQISELSGGQLQRVFLARTFAQSPQVILLDEPTNHLDLKYQLELTHYLTEWAEQGRRCVVAVLHDINLALSFADSILLLQHGRVAAHHPVANFNIDKLSDIYEIDIKTYMRQALKRWE